MSRSARFFFICGLFVLVSVLVTLHAVHAVQFTPINHRVVDAEYSRQLDKIVTISTTPKNQLHIYDPETGQDVAVDLPKPPTCVSVGPDGLHAAVGHDTLISYIDLASPSLIRTYPVSIDVFDIVLAGNGYVYPFQGGYNNVHVKSINLQTGAETSSNGYVYGRTHVRLHPGGQAIYGADNGISPSDIEKYGIAEGTAAVLYDSPYHGDFPIGGDLWISDDGMKIFTKCGRIFRASADSARDMVYNGSIPGVSYISSLAQHDQVDNVLVIPQDFNPVDYPDQVWIYDEDFLQLQSKVTLPRFSVGSSSFAGQGRYVFFNASGDRYYVIGQADSKSGLSLDFGVAAYSLDASMVMYSFQAGAGTGGWISPAGDLSVNQYGSQVFAIVPDKGFEIADVVVDGVSVGKKSSLSFDSITANHTISASFIASTASELRYRMLSHRVVDAEYNRHTDTIVSVSSIPLKQLHIYDPAAGTETLLDLPLAPTCVSIGPDGLHAAVGHDGWISYIDLTVPELIKTYPVSTEVFDIVLAGNGYVYAYPSVNETIGIRSINLQTGEETDHSGYPGSWAGSRIRLQPGGQALYAASSSYIVQRFNIAEGTAAYQYIGAIDYQTKGNLWFSEDGSEIFIGGGNVLRSSNVQSEDMAYNGSLTGLTSIAGLDHSLAAGKIAALPDDTTAQAGKVWVYDDNYLNPIRQINISKLSVDGKSYGSHGRFVFFNLAGDRFYVLAQADSNSGLPIDWAVVRYQTEAESFTIAASASDGGTISPAGSTTVLEGSSLTYTITANPGYTLAALTVDGATVGIPLTYTFSSIDSDHTISAVFTHFDYFGMQAGNHQEFNVKFATGSSQAGMADISSSGGSYLVQQNLDGTQSTSKYQVNSNGLFMERMESAGTTITFSEALPYVKTPLAAKVSWSANTAVSIDGASGTAKITAKVSPMVLVNVPAGYFLAYPIAYTLKFSGRGGTASTVWTDYFAPYFGAVKTSYTRSGIKSVELTGFAMGGGRATTAPPIIRVISPKSAARGSHIQITGYQFGSSQGSGTVRIGNVDCDQIVSWTDTAIECIVPDTATSGAVIVLTDTWTSNNSVALTVTIPPVATGVTPSSGKRGSVVQVLGQNFGTVKGKVKFGTAAATIKQWSAGSITCTVPGSLRPGTYSITVINSQGQSVLPGAFTVIK